MAALVDAENQAYSRGYADGHRDSARIVLAILMHFGMREAQLPERLLEEVDDLSLVSTWAEGKHALIIRVEA